MQDRLKLLALPALGILIGGSWGLYSHEERNELLFMNVGQGDCSVIVSHGTTMLIDVGPKTPTYDAGERVVVPELNRYGLRPDIILLTHPDSDHVGGISAIVRAFPNAQILMSAEFKSSKHMMEQLRVAHVREDHLRLLPSHLQMEVGSFTAEMFCPTWHVGEDTNDGSVVMRLTHNKASAVYMGDAPFKTEYQLIGALDWQSQILKVGHHGSKFSTSMDWLRAVQPKWGVISVGANNRYGHPTPETLGRLSKASVFPLRTDQLGDIWFRETPSGFEMVPGESRAHPAPKL